MQANRAEVPEESYFETLLCGGETAKPCQLNVLRWLASPNSRNRFSNALPKMAPIKEPQSVAQKGAQNCCPKCAQKVNQILPKIKNK